jgi:PST family polysaccharide transporter
MNIGFSLVKMKVAALLLGPSGVGLVGVYQNLIQTGSTVSALGFGTVGTRQIASAQSSEDSTAVEHVRRALMWGSLVLAIVGGLVFWSIRGWIATFVLDTPQKVEQVGWLSLGVALMVLAGSQSALLAGMRRIGDLARVQVISGFAGTLIGILLIYVLGAGGLLALVLVGPVSTAAFGAWYVAKLPRVKAPPTPLIKLRAELRIMAALGTAFMLSGLMTTVGQLTVRALVQHDLGLNALGQFQAAWAIGMTYLTLVLGAMGADYYPRLTQVIGDREAAGRIVNEQTEVALLLCSPLILTMLALAPYVVDLLYSQSFAPASEILRWQLLGDIFKVLSWPLGFVLLAAGAGTTFFIAEAAGMAIFVGAVSALLPNIGIRATGVAFLGMYTFYLPLVWFLARRQIGFRYSASVLRQAGALFMAGASVSVCTRFSTMIGSTLGLLCATLFALYTVERFSRMADVGGRLGKLTSVSRRVVTLMKLRP